MKKLISLIALTLISSLSSVYSADYVASGIVIGVNQPGNAKFDTFKMNFKDSVSSTIFQFDEEQKIEDKTLKADKKYMGLVCGSAKAKGAQAFLVWNPIGDKELPALLNSKGAIYGLGGGANSLMKGDEFKIMVGPTGKGGPFGALDVTVDVWRGKKAVATFSFMTNPLDSN